MFLVNLFILDIYTITLLFIHYYTRSSQSVDENTADMPVGRNVSYVTAPSHATTSGHQATQAVRAPSQGETGPAAEYSSFGPSYEALNSRRQQPVAARNQVSVRLSERYEFSDAHLTAAGSRGGVQGESCMDYEVPQNSRRNEEHDEYSHLRH